MNDLTPRQRMIVTIALCLTFFIAGYVTQIKTIRHTSLKTSESLTHFQTQNDCR